MTKNNKKHQKNTKNTKKHQQNINKTQKTSKKHKKTSKKHKRKKGFSNELFSSCLYVFFSGAGLPDPRPADPHLKFSELGSCGGLLSGPGRPDAMRSGRRHALEAGGVPSPPLPPLESQKRKRTPHPNFALPPGGRLYIYI